MKKFYLLTKTLLVMALLSVGANAWGATLNPTVKMTYVDYENPTTSYGEIATGETARSGYNNLSGTYPSQTVGFERTDWHCNWITYIQVDASALPAGATITAASLTFDQSGATDSKRNTGVGAGYNSSTWSSTMTYNTADKSITTVGDVVWTSTKAAGTFESKTINITDAFTGDADNIVTILLYETNAAGCYIKNPSVTITYTTETAYSVTFAETNSVAATVKIGGSDVTSGTLLTNGTYDFTATATGYHDYEGSFTVSGANKEVSFTMTAKTVYNYSVNAVDGGSNVLASSIVSGSCYKDETASFYIPACVLKDGTLYFAPSEAYSKSETISSADQVISYGYTTSSVGNVVYFSEGENLGGATSGTPSSFGYLASKGYIGRGSNMSITTLPAGSYTIYVKYINTNSGGHNIVVMAGETEVMNESDVKARPTKSASFTLTESTALTVTAAGSSTSGIDYIYIVKTGEVATIGSYGYATFSSKYDLDFTTPISGLTAYKAASATASTITLEEVTGKVKAGDGIVIKGTAGTYSIPVTTGASTIYSTPKTIKMWGYTGDTTQEVPVAGSGTNFVLSVQSGDVVFAPVKDEKQTATLNPGQAALWANVTVLPARGLRMVFADDITGINEAAATTEAKAQEGKFIENGKLVIVKNGKKFNANGQLVK